MQHVADPLQLMFYLTSKRSYVQMLEIVGLYWQGKVIYFIYLVDRKNWEMIYLSQDHKPTLEH